MKNYFHTIFEAKGASTTKVHQQEVGVCSYLCLEPRQASNPQDLTGPRAGQGGVVMRVVVVEVAEFVATRHKDG